MLIFQISKKSATASLFLLFHNHTVKTNKTRTHTFKKGPPLCTWVPADPWGHTVHTPNSTPSNPRTLDPVHSSWICLLPPWIGLSLPTRLWFYYTYLVSPTITPLQFLKTMTVCTIYFFSGFGSFFVKFLT